MVNNDYNNKNDNSREKGWFWRGMSVVGIALILAILTVLTINL